MRVVVASDSEPGALKLKQSLLQNKLCNDVHVLALHDVVERAARFRPQAVLLFVPDNPESALPITQEILEVTQTYVVVVGPAVSAKLILQILQCGASQYIDQEEVDDQLPKSMLRLGDASNLVNRHFGRLIAVVGSGGGSGASTVASNLAAGLAKTHEQCALVDLGCASGDQASILNLQPVHTMADFCRKVERMDTKMFRQCLSVHASGIHLLAAPNTFREFGAVTSRGIRKALGVARSTFDYVVADLDSPFRPEQTKVLYFADRILLTLRPDFASIRRARELLKYFEEMQLDREQIYLVATHYGSPKALRVKEIEHALGQPVQYFVPHDPRRINRTKNQGTPVVVATPRAAVSRELMSICHEMNGHSATNKINAT